MGDIIVALVIIAIVGVALWYIIKAKKSGKKCIGCPESGCECCSCDCAKKAAFKGNAEEQEIK